MASADWLRRILTVALVFGASSSVIAAEDGTWAVAKSSGEVWVASTGAEQVALTQEEALKPGDTIRTGRNGRVLLVRGEETILIAPNSAIGVPSEKKDGMSTTILQQAGSILLEVEKRNVKHFEVETPYLAAVVKGTQFRVTVGAASTSVEVSRGQVEVSDFRSGQIAQVMPGQVATSFTHGKGGLSLSGSGTFNPIEQGKPRGASIERIPVPKGGLTAPQKPGDGKTIHALDAGRFAGTLATAPLPRGQSAADAPVRPNVIRISSPLGEVQLNVQKATHGLAHGAGTSGGIRNASSKDSPSVWSDAKASGSGGASQSSSNGGGSSSGSSSSGSSSSSASGTSAVSTAVAAVTAAASDAGNGNSATGNGNGGVGNGKGKGNAKH